MSEQVGSWEIQAAAHLEEIDRLRKENKALREDAERYRWGLEHPAMMANHFIKWRSNADHYNCRNTGRHPSEAIDAARRGDGV